MPVSRRTRLTRRSRGPRSRRSTRRSRGPRSRRTQRRYGSAKGEEAAVAGEPVYRMGAGAAKLAKAAAEAAAVTGVTVGSVLRPLGTAAGGFVDSVGKGFSNTSQALFDYTHLSEEELEMTHAPDEDALWQIDMASFKQNYYPLPLHTDYGRIPIISKVCGFSFILEMSRTDIAKIWVRTTFDVTRFPYPSVIKFTEDLDRNVRGLIQKMTSKTDCTLTWHPPTSFGREGYIKLCEHGLARDLMKYILLCLRSFQCETVPAPLGTPKSLIPGTPGSTVSPVTFPLSPVALTGDDINDILSNPKFKMSTFKEYTVDEGHRYYTPIPIKDDSGNSLFTLQIDGEKSIKIRGDTNMAAKMFLNDIEFTDTRSTPKPTLLRSQTRTGKTIRVQLLNTTATSDDLLKFILHTLKSNST